MRRPAWRIRVPEEQRRLRRRMAWGLAAALLCWIVLLGDQGLVALARTWKERIQLSTEIARLKDENAELARRIQVLARDREHYEKVAREKLMLKREGELIYRFDGDEF